MKQKFTNFKVYLCVFFLIGVALQLKAQHNSSVDKIATPAKDASGNELPNTWDITLKVDAGSISQESIEPTDVVLVIDASTSMKDNEKMEKTKEAATELVSELIKSHNQVRIGLVRYSSGVAKLEDFSRDSTRLKNRIKGIAASGDTFTQGGIHMAREMLANSNASNKQIILLSDGVATRQYKLNPVLEKSEFIKHGTGNTLVTNLINIVQNSYFHFNQGLQLYVNGAWSNNHYNRSSLQQWDFPESRYKYNQPSPIGVFIEENTLQDPGNDFYYYVPALAAINEANFAKKDGIKIHTVALGLDGLRNKYEGQFAKEVLKSTATSEDNYHEATPENIKEIFSTITNTIKPGIRNGSVEDLIGDGFVLQDINNSNDINSSGDITASIISSKGTIDYDIDADKITWKFNITAPNEVVTIKYRLFLDTTGAHGTPVINTTSTQGPDIGGYDTNKTAILTYDGGKTITFPRPTVKTKNICEINPSTVTDNIKDAQVGISTLGRNNQEWLSKGNQLAAYLVLESTTKGFVIPRYQKTADILNNIGTDTSAGVEEGMIVWDNEANCLKMFFDKNNDGTMTWNCISSNSCTNTKP